MYEAETPEWIKVMQELGSEPNFAEPIAAAALSGVIDRMALAELGIRTQGEQEFIAAAQRVIDERRADEANWPDVALSLLGLFATVVCQAVAAEQE